MKQINVRLPDDIHAKLAAMAEAERRSLNSMLIVLVEAEAQRQRLEDGGARPLEQHVKDQQPRHPERHGP
jgi:hypothetical protein